MFTKAIASTLIAALLMTGTVTQVSPVPGQGVQSTEQSAAAAAALTEQEAAALALDHAGLREEEVTGLKVRLDRDDRHRHWEVQWRCGDWEYDYDISLEGKVLEWDRDYEPVRKDTSTKPTEPKPTEPAPTEPPAGEPGQTERTGITADRAAAIALAHAGFTADQVRSLTVEADLRDRVPHYEVEFREGRWEYEYEIHAETGEILSVEKDD